MDLKNKIVVLTGASGVIGSAIAQFLVNSEAKVALLGRSKEKLKKVSDDIGGETLYYSCNVLSKKELSVVKEDINEKWGKVDILINGAGGNSKEATCDNEYLEKNNINSNQDFFSLNDKVIEENLKLNFMGTFIPCQIFGIDMINREECSILNISSMNAFRPLTKIPAYSAGKAAMQNFTQWLAVYFSKVGIRVNAIAPGFLSTNQNKHLLYDQNGNLTSRAHKIVNNTPMGRFGKPVELIGAIQFFLDKDASGFITGVILPIDGGFNAYSGV